MKQFSNTEAELKKALHIKKERVHENLTSFFKLSNSVLEVQFRNNRKAEELL